MQYTPLIRSAAKFAGGTTLGISVALLLAFNALLLWVATGPRNIDILSPFIEVSLTDSSHNYSISIGETWLIWDGWKHPIDIRLRNVSVLTKERQRFSRFPEISVGMDVLELMRGNLLPSSLTISHPVLSLYQKDDRSISFGFRPEKDDDAKPAESGEAVAETPVEKSPEKPEAQAATPIDGQTETNSVPFNVVLNQLIDPDAKSPLRKLRTVTILNADVSVGNTHSGVFFTATEANLVFKNNHRGAQAFGSAKITYNDSESRLDANFSLPLGEPVINGEVSFGPLMPGTLADLFTSKTEISAFKFPVKGKGKMQLERSGTLKNLDFSLDGGKGTIETDRLDSVLPVTSLHAEGSVSNGGANIDIKQFLLDLDGTTIELQGTGLIDGDNSALHAHVLAKNITNDNMHMFWPLGIAPLSRDWLTKNIYSGSYPQAEAQINIQPGDLAKDVLPKEAIDATIQLQDASISYLPEHPEVIGVKGAIHVDGLSLNAKIFEGHYMRDTTLSNGDLAIDDLNDDNPYIKLAFDAHSSGRDIVKFLGLPRLGHAKRLSLTEDGAEGTVSGHAAVGFRFFASKADSDDDITYDLTADVKDVSQPNLLGKFEIRKATGSVTLDNKHIEFKGSGDVNGASAQEATVKYLFTPEAGYDTFIDTTATTPVAALPRFGYPAFDFIKGTLGVKASLKVGADKEVANATIDMTHATIAFTPVRYTKPDGEPATLELTSEKKDGITTIPNFHVKGAHLDGKGSADLTKDKSDLASVSFDDLTYGDTKLTSMTYEKLEGGFRMDAKGQTADLAPWFASKKGEASTFSFEHFPVMKLNVDVKEVALGEGRGLGAVHGTLDCDRICNAANIDGKTVDGKPFEFKILKNPKGKRQISLHAESAGPLLKAVGIFDSMEGGDLTIIGTYNDKPDRSILRARADISTYTVKDAPVLAKILSLASLSGFFDTLNGKGIIFHKLRAPFTLSNDVLTITDAKTYGDAMGMTIEGNINFPGQILDLSGTIVPSYSLNTVLGKVPVIGAALMGGEGKGVFAASYSIKGSGSEPEVRVNPLSILTPGFLRGLFDIFDSPSKTADDEFEEE